MRYRKLTLSGDYTFGNGAFNFYVDEVLTVAQLIQTRLNLPKGSFWRDTNAGLPIFGGILGSSGSPGNISLIDGYIKDVISGTQGVIAINGFTSEFVKRKYMFTGNIDTQFSKGHIITG